MASQGASARNKGKNGEREIALHFIGAMRQVEAHMTSKGLMVIKLDDGSINPDLPSCKVERNLQQSINGGHDIVGIPGYAPEVKRVDLPNMNAWWQQCLEQAQRAKLKPVLIYKVKSQHWRCKAYVTHDSGKQIVADMVFTDWMIQFQNEYYYLLKKGLNQ